MRTGPRLATGFVDAPRVDAGGDIFPAPMQPRIPDARTIVLLLAVSVLVTIGTELIFKALEPAVLAGLIVLVLGSLYEVRSQILQTAEATQARSDKTLERLITYLRVERAYSPDDWLVLLMEEMLSLKMMAKDKPWELDRMRALLEQAIDTAKRDSGHPYTLVVAHEFDRALHMKRAIEHAKERVRAVSFDAGDYIDRFWADMFSEAYVRSNVEAAARGVKIDRVFVVADDVLTTKERQKTAKLRALLKQLAGVPNITQKVLAIERVPEPLRTTTTSLLTVDDVFASESEGIVDGARVQLYALYGDKDLVRRLNDRFAQLYMIAKTWT